MENLTAKQQLPKGIQVLDAEEMRQITGGLGLTFSLKSIDDGPAYFQIDPQTGIIKLVPPFMDVEIRY